MQLDDKKTLYCFDILVRTDQKDTMRIIFQHTFNQLLPIQARLEKRIIPVLLYKQLY